MNVLYIYSGKRIDKTHGEIHKDFPDTQLYGQNHLHDFRINAEYTSFDELLSFPGEKTAWGFRIKHAFAYIVAIRYDVVIGSSLLYMFFWKKIFRPKTKFVLLNFNINRLLHTHKRHPIRKKILKSLLKESDIVLSVSNEQKKYLLKEIPDLRDRTHVIPLGVDITYADKIVAERNTSKKSIILSVGRDNGRDYETVIRVSSAFPSEQFVIICSKRNIVHIPAERIPKNVEIYLDVSRKELDRYYTSAKCILLLTKGDGIQEGSDCSGQTVLLESMAAGIPIIATHMNYLKEYVDDSEILQVPPYNSDAVGVQLRRLEDSVFRAHIENAVREKARKKFSTYEMARAIADILVKTV